MKKWNVVIWGAGEKAAEVYHALDYDKCELVGIVDRSIEKHGTLWMGKHEILSPDEIDYDNIDFFVVSVQSPDSIVKDAERLQIPTSRLLLFWSGGMQESLLKKEYLLERENRILRMRLLNAPYEYGNSPIKIMNNDMLFERLINEGMSLSRFGDSEFAIINGKKRGWYQKNDDKLAARLYGILNSDQDRVIIGIPDMFGSLDRYTDTAADDMREFLTGPVRNEIMNYLPPDRTYGDAYVTRPYYIYRDKTNMKGIMSLFRKLWHGRNVLILENKYARIGIDNDLFDGAGSIRRIICPNVNAFDYYEKIMESACKHADKNDLILISLGQTATVLAYDLGTAGYHAIDIGQLDTEYEWYLRNASGRIEIPGKAVSEIMWWHEPEQHDNGEYNRQVIISIGDP